MVAANAGSQAWEKCRGVFSHNPEHVQRGFKSPFSFGWKYTHAYIYIYIWVYINISIYIYIHIYIYVQIQINYVLCEPDKLW